jgi:hypothetical protein
MGEDTLFKTARPEGCMRDTLIVEVKTINTETFRGSLTHTFEHISRLSLT